MSRHRALRMGYWIMDGLRGRQHDLVGAANSHVGDVP